MPFQLDSPWKGLVTIAAAVHILGEFGHLQHAALVLKSIVKINSVSEVYIFT